MSLLQHNAPKSDDDAAHGEEFTRGTSHIILAVVVAAVVVTAAIAAYVIAGRKPPVATGEILAVWVHPQHIQTSGFDANGAPKPVESYDQVLVFAKVRLHNQSKQPLYLERILTNAQMPDGIRSCYAGTKSDYDHVFQLYKDLPLAHENGLTLGTYLEPGQDVEGILVSIFNKMPRTVWDARKGLDFSVQFRYQPSLRLAPQGPFIEK